MSEKLRLYDNTRLSAFKRCPRYFYYRHVRDWALSGTSSAALAYGASWHAAMDAIWGGFSDGLDRERTGVNAFAAFLEEWAEQGMPSPDELDYEAEKALAPRTPSNAMEMIIAYIEARERAIKEDFELVAVEQPFAVPLDPEDPTLFYIGKIDKIARRGKRIVGIEHKTTTAYKKDGPFRASFLDSWSPNSQVDGYLYALHLLYPKQVGGVWVDAALVHKTEEGFQLIPVERQLAQLDAWLWETRSWIDAVEANKEAAEATPPSARYMAAFPKNTNSCFDFGQTCPYISLCKAWPNPVGKETPPGFKEEHWDPLEHVKVDLSVLGKENA